MEISTPRKILKWVLLAIVLYFVASFLREIDYRKVMELTGELPATFLGVVLMSFLAYLSATLAWKLTLPKHSNINLMPLFSIRLVAEMLSAFNPTNVIAGDSMKVMKVKALGVANDEAVGSVLLSRVLILVSAIVLSLGSAIYLIAYLLPTENPAISVGIAAILGLATAILLIFLLVGKHELLSKVVNKTPFLSLRMHASIRSINRSCIVFYRENKGKFYAALLLSVLHWVFGALEFYIILKALGSDIGVFASVVMEMGVIGIKTLGVMVPGQLGVEEYGNKIMLAAVGIASAEIWLAVSIFRRMRQLVWLAVAGVIFFCGKFTSRSRSLVKSI